MQCSCGKVFNRRSGFVIHRKYCNGTGTRKDKRIKGSAWSCPKCNNHIHSRRERHVEICDGLGAGAHKRVVGPGRSWRGGKTYEELYGKEKAEEIKTKIGKDTEARIAARQDPEYRKKLSESAKRNSLGGPTKRGGRGKFGWYQGYWCDSSWELAWIIHQLEHNKQFSRNTQGFSYTFRGKTKKYYPDFILPDGTYLEIKGYMSPEFLQKKFEFPHPLIVLMIEELRPIIDYVEKKYGKRFIDLYDSPK